jgi:nucleoside-diphosphate-sugar epimerase
MNMPAHPLFSPETIRLDPVASAALRQDGRRIVIVGAGGWLGRALAAGVFDALGEDEARDRLVCFGSSVRTIEFGTAQALVQQPLDAIGDLEPRSTIVFHLAFLTKDKIAGMAADDYVSANRRLSSAVLGSLNRIGADRVFLASSGAAAFADRADAAADLRLYGGLKLDDERAFSAWAGEKAGRRAVIARIYSLAGPFINKHETYALASFILDALNGRPIEVRATNRVVRSYVAVRELMSLAISLLLTEGSQTVVRFDSGGEPMELGEVAKLVAECLGGRVERAAIVKEAENLYVGDGEGYERLLTHFNLTPIPFAQQIAETAAFLATCTGEAKGRMVGTSPESVPLFRALSSSPPDRM